MKLGIFQGGFKPFHSGHFSKLAVALKENDKVVLFYGVGSRTKGSQFKFTKKMSQSIYEIIKEAGEREFDNNLIIEKAYPTPLLNVFSLIGAIKDQEDKSRAPISKWGIEPEQIEKITVYGDPESLKAFTDEILGKKLKTGEDKEERYYGNFHKEGKLIFDSASNDRMVSAMIDNGYVQNSILNDIINIRGSAIRKFAQEEKWEYVSRYLPPFLNHDEHESIINILKEGVQKYVNIWI